MKIAIIGIRGLPANYGGFETCAEHLSKYWADSENEVLVYCRENHYNKKIQSYNGCRLKYIKSIKTKSLDTLSHTLFSILNLIFFERDVRYVHLYNCGNAIFIPLMKLFRKKVIVSVDGIEWKRKKWGKFAKLIHKTGEWFAVNFADRVVCDNKAVEDYYLEKYNKQTKMIPYGAKLLTQCNDTKDQEILSKYSLSQKKYFIFIGRLVPEKGVHNLIKAYLKLNTKMPLVIIGDDKDTEYKKSLLKYNSDNIKFLGYIYGEKYECLLKNALLYVTASELEGTSPSLLAAMGAGVCTLVNAIEENLYTIEDSGYFYKKNDLEDLISIWSDLLNDNNKIMSMASKGKDYVFKKYDWKVIAENYINLFNEL